MLNTQYPINVAAMKLPSYEGDEVAQAQAQFNEILKQAQALQASSSARIEEIKAKISSIDKEKERIASTTIDEELAADPKLAAQIDSEIQKNSFLVTP